MKRWRNLAPAAALLTLACSSCGYHVAGKADLVPKTVSTIAIPRFANITTRYQLTDRLPDAIGREFISRTRYRIVTDPSQADAVLNGSILKYVSFPTVFDNRTGRASGLQVNVTMQLSLTERASGKVLFERPSFEAHQRYEISVTSAGQYFEESETALARLSQDVARDVVSAILENF